MAATAPPIQSLQEFKRKTTPVNPVRRGRGKRLKLIDSWLEWWDRKSVGGADHAEKAHILMELLKAIREWQRAKEGQINKTAMFRQPVVQELAQQVFARLRYETFEARKQNPLLQKGVRSLQGVYRHERTTYENSGKTAAYSGSSIAGMMQFADKIFDKQGNPFPQNLNFNNLSEQQFTSLIEDFAAENMFQTEVLFLKKQVRLNYMIMIEDGLFYDGPSSLYDTSRCKGGFAYAIDQYGDLISGDDAPKSSIGKMLQSHQRFNHSSLNAGKDVICAGVMKVENGRLTYIDNMSGHYKPTKRNLLNALELLRGLNVDLQRVQVACLDKPPLANKPKIFVHHNATQFLANPLRRPEEILDH